MRGEKCSHGLGTQRADEDSYDTDLRCSEYSTSQWDCNLLVISAPQTIFREWDKEHLYMLMMAMVVYTLEDWSDPLVGLELFPKTSVMLRLQEQTSNVADLVYIL